MGALGLFEVELGAVPPHPVHDDGELARHCHAGALVLALLGNDGSRPLVADPPQPRKMARSGAAINASGSVATDAQHDHGAGLKDISDVAQRRPPFMSLGPRDTVSNETFIIIIRGAVSRSFLTLSSTFASVSKNQPSHSIQQAAYQAAGMRYRLLHDERHRSSTAQNAEQE
jgi:hypothetical protein